MNADSASFSGGGACGKLAAAASANAADNAGGASSSSSRDNTVRPAGRSILCEHGESACATLRANIAGAGRTNCGRAAFGRRA